MFERPRGGDAAVLVHAFLRRDAEQERLTEFQELAASAGAEIRALVTARRDAPDPGTFIGRGKAAELAELRAETESGVVIFNHSLSPAQERNLERLLQCRVLDRTGLILDIFAQRARTFEGKLQVELAQLQHLSTRLVRGWSHLERQRGGIGLRGPGEKQLETDRRLLGERIRQIHRQLDQVRTRRDLGRRARRKASLPIVSLVGYTNAGKSTLFNRLTAAAVLQADQLFATLDPTSRRVELPGDRALILVDTVGFIRHLPHDLVAAFRATLEETREADLLVHVIDAADPDARDKAEQVEAVLEEIGAEQVPRIEVYNKADAVAEPGPDLRGQDGHLHRVWVSAATGAGVETLRQALDARFRTRMVRRVLRLPASAGRLRAALHALGAVREEDLSGTTWVLEVEGEAERIDRLCHEHGTDPVAASEPAP